MEWSKLEDKLLTKHYPILGTKSAKFLHNRSIDSIEHRARRLGIKYMPIGEGPAGYLDIESSGLQGDFNFMISWCIKTADKDEILKACITPEEIFNGTLDKRIVKELIETLYDYRRIYTYYGSMFDVPMVRTRALYHKLEFIPYGLIEHKDIYYLARRILRMHSKRLESVCNLLGIKGKTHIQPRIWVMASSGNKKALDYILGHNKKDVEILEKAYKKLQIYEGRTRRFI
uniref:Putative RNase_H superfamily protein n=1 Tax=viral metagenome TaxID=1070528 RepID=A0A6M3XH58_9ZZZZ